MPRLLAPAPGSCLLLPLLLLAPLLLLPTASASCFGRSAHFKKTVAPVIVQPVKTDNTKVLVSWDQAIEKPQCVDRYWLRVWPDGTDMARGARHVVNETDAKKQVVLTKTVSIEPCVTYKFLVELEELGTVFGADLEKTAAASFRADGVAVVDEAKLADSKVLTTYLWDPVRHMVDLTKAVLSIPKTAITNANCLDYVQVTGAEVISTMGPSLSSSPSTRGAVLTTLTRGCEEESTSYDGGKKPEVVAGVQSWAACSEQCDTKTKCSSWTWARPSSPGDHALRCTLLEGHTSSSPDVHTVSGPRGCTPTSTSPTYNPAISVGAVSTLPGRLSYSSVAGGSSSQSPPTSQARPAFAHSLPRDRKGAARMVGPLKLAPPYLQPSIDITVPVEDCAGYMYHIQLHGARKRLGELPAVPLPPLADLPSYLPPPATSVVTVAVSPKGAFTYSLLPSSPVPLSCLPAYFEALDSYTQRVEREVIWLRGEESRVRVLTDQAGPRLGESQQQFLKVAGCTCTSPLLELATTDQEVLKKKEASQLGKYTFGGMHGDHPFYKKITITTPKTSMTTTTPPTPEEPMFLFFHASNQQWVFSKELGSTSSLFFSTVEKSAAKCPGDSTSRGSWQSATGSFGRWKANPLVTVVCQSKL